MSLFQSTSIGIDKPLERSFGSIRKSLERAFGVNPETHVLSVQVVVNWEGEDGTWDLMGIENTTAWQKYIDAATLRGWSFDKLV